MPKVRRKKQPVKRGAEKPTWLDPMPTRVRKLIPSEEYVASRTRPSYAIPVMPDRFNPWLEDDEARETFLSGRGWAKDYEAMKALVESYYSPWNRFVRWLDKLFQ